MNIVAEEIEQNGDPIYPIIGISNQIPSFQQSAQPYFDMNERKYENSYFKQDLDFYVELNLGWFVWQIGPLCFKMFSMA